MNNTDKDIRQANAKVNLALRITGKREDGYHTISTLFQEIDLSDELEFKVSDRFQFTCSNSNLPIDKDNLCVAAYTKFMERIASSTRNEFTIHLKKNIPIGAGLGGGSSNAATVLKYLNSFYDQPLSEEQLIKMGSELGADVPFFIKGGTQAAHGIGDKLFPVNIDSNFKILGIMPDFSISTKWAYKNFSLTSIKDRFNFERLILDGRPEWQLFENQFEKVISQSYPEISRIKKDLLDQGAKYAGLSGSGSTVIGVFSEEEHMGSVVQKFGPYDTFITKPIFND